MQITAGPKANGGRVRIDAIGPNGTIELHSDQLYWTISSSNSSSPLDSAEHGDTHGGGTHHAQRIHHDDNSHRATMRVGAEGLNVHDMMTVNLSAQSFFGLAVVGAPGSFREVTHGGAISGNERSVNISGGAVGVEVGASFTPFASRKWRASLHRICIRSQRLHGHDSISIFLQGPSLISNMH